MDSDESASALEAQPAFSALPRALRGFVRRFLEHRWVEFKDRGIPSQEEREHQRKLLEKVAKRLQEEVAPGRASMFSNNTITAYLNKLGILNYPKRPSQNVRGEAKKT